MKGKCLIFEMIQRVVRNVPSPSPPSPPLPQDSSLLSFPDVDGHITYASATDLLLATDAELTEMTGGRDTDEEFARIINDGLEVRLVVFCSCSPEWPPT